MYRVRNSMRVHSLKYSSEQLVSCKIYEKMHKFDKEDSNNLLCKNVNLPELYGLSWELLGTPWNSDTACGLYTIPMAHLDNVVTSAIPSKNAICTNIKHNYFHQTSNFSSIHSHGKLLYGNMLDVVDVPLFIESIDHLLISSQNFQGKRK